ncbi:MAG: sigma-54-dependent Fis family transcriptional regulator [Candidatus Omnitrophica bacterium]|nr:sigma-54-dependent Fis family transcriptional regulator [Candidatus Omnitrophota bacterium]
MLSSLTSGLEKKGFFVHSFLNASDALKSLENDEPVVVVTDILMPDMDGIELMRRAKQILPDASFVVITAHGSLDSAIQALRLGAVDYLVKPFRLVELVFIIQKAMGQRRLIPLKKERGGLHERYQLKNLLSEDPRMIEIFNMVSKIAKTDVTVLIMGESGTGKEMMARSIHFNSKRKNNPFVSVNCAAIPETLLESELFGYEKGAFTGAMASKPGLFEVASGGTFFLDEVADIPMSLQVKLLRVLQERVVTHLGGIREIPIDIRLIAATSKNLKKEVDEGRFREDLFYRISVVPVTMLPLRERSVDVMLFAEYFIDYYTKHHRVNRRYTIDQQAALQLRSYHWPGNIRELGNLMERIVTLEEKEIVTTETLTRLMAMDKNRFSFEPEKSMGNTNLKDLSGAVEELEKKMIVDALQRSRGNKFKAARELELTRQSLQYKIKKYDIDTKDLL